MPTLSFKAKLTTWEVLSDNLKTKLEEVPHLTENQGELEQLLAEGRALEAQQGIHTAALRETNRLRVVLEQRGDVLRERMAAALRHRYGVSSRRLHEFGIKPKAERRRRSTLEQKRQSLELRQHKLELETRKLAEQRQKLEQQAAQLERQANPAGPTSPQAV